MPWHCCLSRGRPRDPVSEVIHDVQDKAKKELDGDTPLSWKALTDHIPNILYIKLLLRSTERYMQVGIKDSLSLISYTKGPLPLSPYWPCVASVLPPLLPLFPLVAPLRPWVVARSPPFLLAFPTWYPLYVPLSDPLPFDFVPPISWRNTTILDEMDSLIYRNTATR